MTYVEGDDVYRIEHFEAVFLGGFEISKYLQIMHVKILGSKQTIRPVPLNNKAWTNLKSKSHGHPCNIIHVVSSCAMGKIPMDRFTLSIRVLNAIRGLSFNK